MSSGEDSFEPNGRRSRVGVQAMESSGERGLRGTALLVDIDSVVDNLVDSLVQERGGDMDLANKEEEER